MKIIVDENIPFASEAFSTLGNVTILYGREITNEKLRDADALIVRSITNVNEELLKDTNVRFVGSATIGTDHIDLSYLQKKNIRFASAKGCNAAAVAEYLFTALFRAASEKNIKLNEYSIGIIGAGNIGSRTARIAQYAGMKVILNDPPLQREHPEIEFASIEEALDADIITFHVPLNLTGEDKTVHLLNEERIKNLSDGKIIINTSRGRVVDNKALNEWADRKDFTLIFDVWENEPEINLPLLEKCFIGTPHIAGYSLEGKVRGTEMVYLKLCRFLDKKAKWKPVINEVENNLIELNELDSIESTLSSLLNKIYDIKNDDEKLRMMLNIPPHEQGAYFDGLRKDYKERREFCGYDLKIKQGSDSLKKLLKVLRFNLI
jgi:erythronate-4-phosphate dehydrogenase